MRSEFGPAHLAWIGQHQPGGGNIAFFGGLDHLGQDGLQIFRLQSVEHGLAQLGRPSRKGITWSANVARGKVREASAIRLRRTTPAGPRCSSGC